MLQRPAAKSWLTSDTGSRAAPTPARTASRTMIIDDRRRTGSIAMVERPVAVMTSPDLRSRPWSAHHGRHGRSIRGPRKVGAGDHDQTITQEGATDEGLVRIRIDADHQIVAFLDHVDGRSSVVTSSRTSGYFRANSAASLPIAVCENSSGALMRNRPRGVLAARSDRRRGLVQLGQQRGRPLVQRPALLGELQRSPPRSNRRRPRLASSSATRRDKVALGRPAARAARPNPPCRATRLKSRGRASPCVPPVRRSVYI
jgi:hypothetical protein